MFFATSMIFHSESYMWIRIASFIFSFLLLFSLWNAFGFKILKINNNSFLQNLLKSFFSSIIGLILFVLPFLPQIKGVEETYLFLPVGFYCLFFILGILWIPLCVMSQFRRGFKNFSSVRFLFGYSLMDFMWRWVGIIIIPIGGIIYNFLIFKLDNFFILHNY
jgi:hypothetical protein